MFKISILLFFIMRTLDFLSQNFVLNPSFEEYDLKLKYPKYWQRTTLTPDIYTKDETRGHSEFKTKGYYPQHLLINNLKNTFGNVYVGIVTSENGFGEMIGGNLITPLVKNCLYKVKLKTIRSKTFGIIAPKKINVFITANFIQPTKTDSTVKYDFPFLQLYKTDSTDIISLTEWVDVSATYCAIGGEKYIYISSQELQKEKGILTLLFDSVGVYSTNIFINKPVCIDSIFFETGKDKLTTDSKNQLNKLLVIFNENKIFKIKINGHTDNQGSSDKNMQLSISRAKSVLNYLILKGISKSRLQCNGYGDSKPVFDNNTEGGRAKNRRIEFEFIN